MTPLAKTSGLAGAVLLALALAGCDSNEPDPAQRAASGQVLPPSASDEMLPYGRTRSQPELISPDVDDAAAETGAEAQAEGPDAAASDAAAPGPSAEEEDSAVTRDGA